MGTIVEVACFGFEFLFWFISTGLLPLKLFLHPIFSHLFLISCCLIVFLSAKIIISFDFKSQTSSFAKVTEREQESILIRLQVWIITFFIFLMFMDIWFALLLKFLFTAFLFSSKWWDTQKLRVMNIWVQCRVLR